MMSPRTIINSDADSNIYGNPSSFTWPRVGRLNANEKEEEKKQDY